MRMHAGLPALDPAPAGRFASAKRGQRWGLERAGGGSDESVREGKIWQVVAGQVDQAQERGETGLGDLDHILTPSQPVWCDTRLLGSALAICAGPDPSSSIKGAAA